MFSRVKTVVKANEKWTKWQKYEIYIFLNVILKTVRITPGDKTF